MNNQLRDERTKAMKLLNNISSPSSQSFNLSELKTDKTQFIESPSMRAAEKQNEFEPSARSTALGRATCASGRRANLFMDDIGEIMQSSSCEAVKKRYRDSIAGNPHDRPYRTTMSTDMNVSTASSFYGRANGAAKAQCIRLSDESFKPGEEFNAKLDQEELEHEQENATIPGYDANKRESSLSDATNQPEYSFGAHCNQYQNDNIWNLYGNPSPPKKSRVPLIDMTNDEVSVVDGTMINDANIKRMLKNMSTPHEKAEMFYTKNLSELHRIINDNTTIESDSRIQGCARMLNNLDLDKITDLSEREVSRQRNQRSKKKFDDDLVDIFPSKENSAMSQDWPETSRIKDPVILKRNPLPGVKTAPPVFATPLSALEHYLRPKSPKLKKKAAAERAQKLKPAVSEAVFKIPDSINESSSNFRMKSSHRSGGEKLSLPNYNQLERATTSPISKSSMSRESGGGGQLKRATSQLSTGSEFNDENLPIKFPKSQRKISFPSTKVQTVNRLELTIQNGSDKKLPLKVHIKGAGFTIAIQENIRMLAQEVRSIEIQFRPTQVGAYRGEVVFELTSNSSVFKKIPLFGYGGHATMRIEGWQKAPVGPNFVTMGMVKNINAAMEKRLTFTNMGNIPGFAVVAFEKSKIAELCCAESVHVEPEEFRLYPGESRDVMIEFKPKKSDIRKIISVNKEVTVVGELYVLTGDDATRLRLLNRKDQVPKKLIEFFPKFFDNEEEIQDELVANNFHENFDERTLGLFSHKIFTTNVALTLDRNLDETQMIAAQISLSDESMSFCDEETTFVSGDNEFEEKFDEDFYLESRHFRVSPASLVFNIRSDCLRKSIRINSTSEKVHYVEAVSSNPNLISAQSQCGQLRPGQQLDIEVKVKPQAFEEMESASIVFFIGDARVELPVRFV